MHGLLALRALVWIVVVTFSLASIPHVDRVLGVLADLLSPPLYAAETETIQSPESEAAPPEPQPAQPAAPDQEKPETKAPTTPTTPSVTTTTTEEGANPTGVGLAAPNTTLFSGAGVISIPIEVPPGRAGIAPNLALTYNNYVGNGWIGVGWTLEMGSIQRSTKHGVSYDSGSTDFVAMINGSSSELVRQTAWDTGGYYGYEAKIEGAYTKYLYSPGSGWLVTTKNGTTYYYGQTTDSRQDFNSGNDIFKWCLDTVQDVNGNTMTVSYWKDPNVGNNEIYLYKIYYTSNTSNGNNLSATHQVVFDLDDGTRTDTPVLYTSNYPVKTQNRLRTITVLEGAATVRSYELTYTSSAYTGSGRSLLASVTKKGSNGDPLPATTFTWQNDAMTSVFSPTGLVITTGVGASTNPLYWFSGDINGDGKTDYMLVENVGGYYQVAAGIANGNGSFSFTGLTSTGLTSFNTPVYFFPGDINGDGKTDFMGVYNAGAQMNVFAMLSDGTGGFSVVGPASTGISSSYNAPLYFFPGDVNGDGKTDFMAVYNSGYYQMNVFAMLSTGSGFTGIGPASTGISSFYNAPLYWFSGDVNGDGKADFMGVYNAGAQMNVFAMLSDGTGGFTGIGPASTGISSSNAPLSFFPGDVNGDGKTDFMGVCAINSQMTAFAMLSNGTGGFSAIGGISMGISSYTTPFYFFPGDVNGDGKTDFMGVYNDGTWMEGFAMLSNGMGGFANTGGTVMGVSTLNSPNYWFSGDVNGDGKTGFMTVANTGSQYMAGVAFAPPYSLDLLLTGTNPLGGSFAFSYAPSSAWNNTLLPFILQTVTQLQVNDGRGTTSTTNYAYSGGLFNFADRAFWGFAHSDATAMNGTSWEMISETDYYQYDPTEDPTGARKGLISQQVNTAKEGHSKHVVNTVDVVQITGTDAKFPRLTGAVVTNTDVNYPAYTSTVSYTYDSYFNVSYEHKVDTTNNEAIDTGYVYNTAMTGTWILSKPDTVTVYDTTGAIASRKWMYYDTNGNLTTEELCLHSLPIGTACEDNSRGSASHPITRYTLCADNTGNVCTITDPRGFSTTLTYDTTKTYVATKSSCVDPNCTASLTTTTVYDTGLGKVTSMVPPHLQGVSGNPAFTYDYDNFGRIWHEHTPDDTARGGYTQYIYSFPGSPTNNGQYVQKLEHIVNGSTSLDHYATTYLDGLGRTYVTEATGAPLDILTLTEYDVLGRVLRTWNPYFAGAAPNYYAEYTYDGFSRVITVTKPDFSTINTQYQGLTKRVQNERGYWTSYLYDAFGRLRKVTDALNTQTDYTYSATGNLTTVTAASNTSLSNVTTMTYDSTGKKTAMTDPDMGSWSYVYDQSGNLTCQYDAKQQVVAFTYDGLNRVTYKKYYATGQGITCSLNLNNYTPTNTVTYWYDGTDVTPARTYAKGMLTKVSDPSGGETKVDQVLELDIMQRITKSQKSIGASSPATIAKTYDSVGRTITLTYFPDTPASLKAYQYTYDTAGNLTSLHDNTLSRDIAVYSNFTVMGQYQTAAYPKTNGSVVSYYTYDPVMGRIATLLSQKEVSGNAPVVYQNLSYLFDFRGNLQTKTDTLTGITHTYAYDQLDRLTSVTGSGALSYSQTYAYDEIGNIICKSDVGTYHYASGKPHAVSSTTGGPVSLTLTYDNNGNMHTRAVSGGDTLTITYNADNKPTAIQKNSTSNYVQYAYDGNGRRVKKIGPTTTTLYYGEAYEERTTGGSTVGIIHLFAGSRRVVSIRTDSNEQWYLTDHLGSASIVTDGAGALQEKIEYFPYGSYRERSDYTPSFPDVNYTFTDQEEDDEIGLYNYGARLYDPLLGRFISADSVVPNPGDLQALNRYSYCLNNPILYTDPSGHIIGIDDVLIGMAIMAAIGAVAGGSVAAADGGNILQGMATGAISGSLVYLGGVPGGALAGVINASITGGNIGQGALWGAVGSAAGILSGYGVGQLGIENAYVQAGVSMAAGGVVGGGVSALAGGSFAQGFTNGLIGGAAAYFASIGMGKVLQQSEDPPQEVAQKAGVSLQVSGDSTTPDVWKSPENYKWEARRYTVLDWVGPETPFEISKFKQEFLNQVQAQQQVDPTLTKQWEGLYKNYSTARAIIDFYRFDVNEAIGHYRSSFVKQLTNSQYFSY